MLINYQSPWFYFYQALFCMNKFDINKFMMYLNFDKNDMTFIQLCNCAALTNLYDTIIQLHEW